MKKSFFEKLTGSHHEEDEELFEEEQDTKLNKPATKNFMGEVEEENEEGQLTVDVYQTPNEIVIQSIIAGVRSEELDVSITQDMVIIKGKREDLRRIEPENFFYQELYWGSFSRTILLPQEIDPDKADANLKEGLLTIKLPKLDKSRTQKLRIKKE